MRGWIVAFAVLLLAGCLSAPSNLPCKESSRYKARLVTPWEELDLPVSPHDEGWPSPIGEPAHPGVIGAVDWRPDGATMDPARAGMSEFSWSGGNYTAPVTYRLGWGFHDDVRVLELGATYDKDVPSSAVRADLERFLDLVGGPADAPGFVAAFIASATGRTSGVQSCSMPLPCRASDDPEVIALDYRMPWTGPDPTQTLLPHVAVTWNRSNAFAPGLAFLGSYDLKSLYADEDEPGLELYFQSDGTVFGSIIGPGDERSFDPLLASHGIVVRDWALEQGQTCD